MFGHPAYYMDGTGPSISESGPHEDFQHIFGIYIGGKYYSYGCCRPIIMHKVWSSIVLRKNRVEHLSSLSQEVSMIQERFVPVKHGMAYRMLAIKDSEVKAEDIPVYIHQGHTVTK